MNGRTIARKHGRLAWARTISVARPAPWFAPIYAAFAIGTGVVLGTFGRGSLPADYLVRPVAVIVLLSFGIGVAALRTGGYAVAFATVAMAFVMSPRYGIAAALVIVAVVIVARLRHASVSLGGPVLAVATMFMLAGVLNAAPLLDLSPPAPLAVPAKGPPTYIVLLDGYGRSDSLASLGIDNSSFIRELEGRGFDHYADAHSLHGWTQLTLTALLTGQIEEDRLGDQEATRRRRATWTVPSGFATVAPPIGTRHYSRGFEARLRGYERFRSRPVGSKRAISTCWPTSHGWSPRPD